MTNNILLILSLRDTFCGEIWTASCAKVDADPLKAEELLELLELLEILELLKDLLAFWSFRDSIILYTLSGLLINFSSHCDRTFVLILGWKHRFPSNALIKNKK
jgi:hypothetical protein